MIRTRPIPVKPKIGRGLKASASLDPVELSKTVGKGLTLWVLFTSGLNWLMYRRINKDK